MKSIFSGIQRIHDGHHELYNGALVPGFEKSSRCDFILQALRDAKLGDIDEPAAQSLVTAEKIHSVDYLRFLSSAWDLWTGAGRSGTALPYAWPARGMDANTAPTSIDGLLGYYSIDASTGFVEGTWEAAKASQDTALTAADTITAGEHACFALCRPPGHHAGADASGGYCYLNNAAIATQRLFEGGVARVSILDIDYHHGNGTQGIFYERNDVQFLSIHADPRVEYPFFSGYTDERGRGAGEGFNVNFPLPEGTTWESWRDALQGALREIHRFGADVLVVSLGVDTFENDPISRFRLAARHFPLIGAQLATIGSPTLFVMEGGYAVEELGLNVAGLLTGFEDARRR